MKREFQREMTFCLSFNKWPYNLNSSRNTLATTYKPSAKRDRKNLIKHEFLLTVPARDAPFFFVAVPRLTLLIFI